MYTLKIINGKYHLYKNKEMIAKLQNKASVQTLCNLMGVSIQRGELLTAIEFMENNKHNVAEFGVNGYFTVSYADTM